MSNRFHQPPSLADIERMAVAAFGTIPEFLRRQVDGVAFLVEDFPDAEVEVEMRLESPFDLLGLYTGVSIDRKGVGEIATDVDRIMLYRRPILDYWCETGEDLTDIIRHVLIHEIGHHFGLSDDDMEAIERDANERGDP